MRKHFVYYLSLLVVLFSGFSLSIYLSGQKQLQIAIIMLTAFLYVLWGVVHHILHHSFSTRIMLEYLAIAILGVTLIFFVLQIGL